MSDTAKSKLIFWLRFAGWLGVGCAAPIITFAVKFGLFDATQVAEITDSLGNVTKTNISLNGWGIISVIVIGYYLGQVLKELVDANGGYSLLKQCYTGLVKIVPLAIAYGVCYFLKGVIDQVQFCLAILIICRLAAIPLNPLPKWKYDKQGEENYDDLLDSLLTTAKQRLKKGD